MIRQIGLHLRPPKNRPSIVIPQLPHISHSAMASTEISAAGLGFVLFLPLRFNCFLSFRPLLNFAGVLLTSLDVPSPCAKAISTSCIVTKPLSTASFCSRRQFFKILRLRFPETEWGWALILSFLVNGSPCIALLLSAICALLLSVFSKFSLYRYPSLGRQNRERRGGERKVRCLSDLKKDLNLNGSRNSSTLSLLLVA